MSRKSAGLKSMSRGLRGTASVAQRQPMPARRDIEVIEQGAHLLPFDENLLDRARTQWQFGDWESLAKLERETIRHHPDRAKLALFAAAGLQQQGDVPAAREYCRLALEWGCSKLQLGRILLSGIHNTLGIATAALPNRHDNALQHFRAALEIGLPGCASELLSQARAREQLKRIAQPTAKTLPPLSGPPAGIDPLVQRCIEADDLYEEIDKITAQNRLEPSERAWFYVLLGDRFISKKDNLTAFGFFNTAREIAGSSQPSLTLALVKRLISLGRSDEAADLVLPTLLSTGLSGLDERQVDALQRSYQNVRAMQIAEAEHGHEVLLSHLREHWEKLSQTVTGRKPVLIEIGTTRENVTGQGSSRKIAEFCKDNSIHFITVDMDPHNTQVAADMFSRLGLGFEAINMKGEDYLRTFSGTIDFVFLDAYDFDHGKHSALRQSRYEKFIGSRINDAECHQMHLDCAQSVLSKLAPHGLVCIDDTWLENGKWTAKGTLAMPYLLDNGFRLLEARNRAALLSRTEQ